MGLSADIYKGPYGDCSNGGISGRVIGVTVVNVDGPFDPTPERPAVILKAGAFQGTCIAEPVDEDAEPTGTRTIGPMMGGCYISTSDGRFMEAVEKITGARFYGAVPLHDRFETPDEYRAMSI